MLIDLEVEAERCAALCRSSIVCSHDLAEVCSFLEPICARSTPTVSGCITEARFSKNSPSSPGGTCCRTPFEKIHCGRVLCRPFFLRLGPIDECRFFSGESLGEFLGIELFECALGVLVLPTQQTCSFSCQPTSHPPWLNFTPHLPDQNSCFEGKEKPFWGHEDRGRRRIPSEEPRPFRHRQQDRRLGGLASSV